MIWAAVAPLVVTALFVLAGRRLTPSMSGRAAATLIAIGSVVCALATGLVLCALGCLALAQSQPLARLGGWSGSVIAAHDPLPAPVALACGVIACGLLGTSIVHFVRTVRAVIASAALSRRQRADAGADGLVVLRDERADAYALAGWPGVVVVTSGMLRALPRDERAALLAHEDSHVRHHHHLYVSLTSLAAAANPLLRALVPYVEVAVERWADSDAAADVEDPELVARTLARAGLARTPAAGRLPFGALAAARSAVAQRVTALTTPAVGTVPDAAGVTLLSLCVLAAAVCSLAVGLQSHNIVESAQILTGRNS